MQWAGDVMGRDASIILQQVKFTYNGTYICQVKNPPDVHGAVGEIRLRVVTTGQHFDVQTKRFFVCTMNTVSSVSLGTTTSCQLLLKSQIKEYTAYKVNCVNISEKPLDWIQMKHIILIMDDVGL